MTFTHLSFGCGIDLHRTCHSIVSDWLSPDGLISDGVFKITRAPSVYGFAVGSGDSRIEFFWTNPFESILVTVTI